MSESLQIDLTGVNFTIGFPCSYYVPVQTVFSLIKTFREFQASGISINCVSQIGCSIVDSARNNVVHDFLKEPEAHKLIWIDSDMEWEPQALLRLCCWSSIYPIVGALYSTKVEGNQKFLGDYRRGESGLVEQNEHGLARMNALGMGMCIMDRSVFETMMPTTQTYTDNQGNGPIYSFFEMPVRNGHKIGEDIYFFRRWIEEFNGEVWVDPDIEIGHVGSKTYYGGSPRKAIGIFNDNLSNEREQK